MKPLLTAMALVFSLSQAFAAAPMLEGLEPRGAQRGKAFKLTLIGAGLPADAEIVSPLPASITPLTPPKQGPRQGRELPYLVELPADAPVDVYPIRVRTKDGLSNLLLFTVGAFPEVLEEESQVDVKEPLNDAIPQAQRIATPVTVNGTLRGPDRDFYSFQAQAGERLVFEVEARRAGSAIDPVVRVLDEAGREIARNDDTLGLGVDSRVEVTFQKPGAYYAVVHDSKFSEQKENFYRLKVGRFAYGEGIFPLGWQRGGEVEVDVFGGNLPAPVKVRPPLQAAGEWGKFVPLAMPGDPGALPLRFLVGEEPEVFEPAGGEPKTLPPSTVVNGRLAEPGEVDRYRLAVRPGELWQLELQAASLGASRLYAVLTVYDAEGNRLASAGDDLAKGSRYSVISSTAPGDDPRLSLTVPENLQELTLTVEDLIGRGGPDYTYRLSAKRAPPDFELTLATPYVNIPARGSASVLVSVNRHGYYGPLKVTIPNLPDDMVLSGGHLVPASPEAEDGLQFRQAFLTLTPKPGARPQVMNLAVWGEGIAADGPIRRRAQGPGLITAIQGEGQQPYLAPWLNIDLPAAVAPEKPATLEILTPQYVRLILGMSHEIKWSFTARQAGISPPQKIDVRLGMATFVNRGDTEDGAGEGVLTLVTTETAGFGTETADLPLKFDVLLSGDVKIDGRREVIYAPAITLELVLGYGLEVPGKFTLLPGGSTILAGKVTREPGFTSPISIKIDNLPPHVACEAVEVVSESDEFRLPCAADAQAPPGEYEIELAASSRLTAEKDKYVPLRMPPIKTQLTVGPGGTVARAAR